MARRRKKKSLLDYIALPEMPSLDLDPDTKKGIFIVFIFALGGLSLLSLFDLAGQLGSYFSSGLLWGFGWGKWIVPPLLFMWGYLLFDDERFEVRGSNYLGLFLFILSFQAFLFLFIEFDKWPEAIDAGAGGGYVGLWLAKIFMNVMGFIASFLVLLSLLVVSILLMFNTTLTALFGRESIVAKMFYPVNYVIAKIFHEKEDDDEEEDEEEEDEEEEDEEEDGEEDEDGDDDEEGDEEEDEGRDEDEEEGDNEDEDGEDEEEDEKDFKSSPVKDVPDEGLWWQRPTNIKISLPPGLLAAKKGKPTSGDIEQNKEIIQKALDNFGIPVDMGEVSVGPTVTQYTFRPAEGIKLSKITNLSNDLALALAAHPIRIEAPIPGKHLVGIEVPNQAKAIVGLREILFTKEFKNRKSNLMMAFGKDVSGRSWQYDITRMPHLLVAGATNSGKSVCLNALIVSLLYQNNPDDLRFIMVDPKRVELPVYNGIPHLLTPVITDVNKTINALKWCLNEMDRRFDVLSKAGMRNIQTYNEAAAVKMPYIVFIIDELADLMVAAARDIEGGVIRLAQMARAVGIHLVLATQRPSVDVITGLIKANMPARIAFSVASGTDSRTILDTLGAEKLLGRGDMLYLNAEISKPVRLQGAFVSDDEIKKIVRFIKSKAGNTEYLAGITDKQKVGGIGGYGMDGGGDDDEDDLLGEARDLIVNQGKASASLLQRRLSIGYARAARILDILERQGVVGPANGAKPREILMSKEQYAGLEERGVSGASLHSRDDSEPPDSYLEEEDEDTPPVFKKDGESFDDARDKDEEESEDDDEDGENEDEEEGSGDFDEEGGEEDKDAEAHEDEEEGEDEVEEEEGKEADEESGEEELDKPLKEGNNDSSLEDEMGKFFSK